MRPTTTYTMTDGRTRDYPMVGYGPAQIAIQEELDRDELGYTDPNLHRRTDPKEPKDLGESPEDQKITKQKRLHQEYFPRDYKLAIQGTNSYRSTELFMHDEEALYDEIP